MLSLCSDLRPVVVNKVLRYFCIWLSVFISVSLPSAITGLQRSGYRQNYCNCINCTSKPALRSVVFEQSGY